MAEATSRFSGGAIRAVALSMMAAVGVGGCALHAATSGQVGATNSSHGASSAPTYAAVSVQFSDRDRELIRDYYRGARKKTPPGLAKREQLPPGLAKRQSLPPGLQGRGLPSTLESRLTRLPAAYMRVVIGADVAIIERASRVVIDVIYDVAA